MWSHIVGFRSRPSTLLGATLSEVEGSGFRIQGPGVRSRKPVDSGQIAVKYRLNAQVVCFDLVGTLVRGTRPIGEQYAEQARAFGASPDAGRLESAFRTAMKAATPCAVQGRSAGETSLLEREWWGTLVRRVIEQAGLSGALGGPVFEAFFDALFEHFATADAWQLFPDVLPTFQQLKSRGVRLGLVTNFDTRVYPLVDALGIGSFLDSVSIPALVGAAKPEPAIFAHALAQLGTTTAEALHVGDELDDDYEGAEAAGLGAVLVDRGRRFVERPGLRRIDSLVELLEFV
jgi:putative hydrolase of the HAD superfamily